MESSNIIRVFGLFFVAFLSLNKMKNSPSRNPKIKKWDKPLKGWHKGKIFVYNVEYDKKQRALAQGRQALEGQPVKSSFDFIGWTEATSSP